MLVWVCGGCGGTCGGGFEEWEISRGLKWFEGVWLVASWIRDLM